MSTASSSEWPPMIWIGGAQGAGKSTVAWALSRDHDLPLHPVDLWTYDHAARLPPGGSLDAELVQGPERAADAFEVTSRLRLRLVLDDVTARGLGRVPALVEGPQLAPALADQLPPGYGAWLVPDPVRTRAAREQRLAANDVPAQRLQLEALLRRDDVLAKRRRRDAIRAGRPVVEVPPRPDWGQIRLAVEAALLPALRDSPRLQSGPQLRGQRRLENVVARRQLQLWSHAVGLSDPPRYCFACECGGRRCALTWRATPAEYAALAAKGPVVPADHA